MVNITKEQIEELRPFVKNIDKLITPEKEPNDLLNAIDDAMLDALDENYEATKESALLCKLFDAIYNAN